MLKGAVLTDLDIIFQDTLFKAMADKNSVLDDIQRRVNIFRQILDSVASIRKCVPHTTLTNIALPDHAFSCPRSVFDEAVKSISNQMSMDEQQTARAIEEMLANLNMQNIGILIPTLNSLRGAIQRPRIKKYL